MHVNMLLTVYDSSVSAPVVWCQAGSEKIGAYSGRPKGGGPICLVYLFAGDGREFAPPIDLRALVPDLEDSVLASPFLSDFDGTIKCWLSYKPSGSPSANDRRIAILETGIVPEVTP